MVPHLCSELWERTGHSDVLDNAGWPDFDPDAAREEELTIVVQVNGKVRGRMIVPIDITDEILKQKALADQKIKKFISDKPVKKIITVKNKLINIVI